MPSPDPTLPEKPEESYFFEDDAAPQKSNANEVLHGVVDILATMSLCIPVAGALVFGALEAVSKFAFKEDAEPKINLADTLRTTLRDCFDEESCKEASVICDEIASSIKIDRELGMFRTANWNRKEEYTKLADTLLDRSDGDKSDSLGTLIRTTLGAWKWNDNSQQALLMDLHCRYFQCFQLRCILFANLAHAAEVHKDEDGKRQYKQQFIDELARLKLAVKERKQTLKDTIHTIQMLRLKTVTNIVNEHVPGMGWIFSFMDSYSKRKWTKSYRSDEAPPRLGVMPWDEVPLEGDPMSWDEASAKAQIELGKKLRDIYIDLLLHHTWDRMIYMNQLLTSFDQLTLDIEKLSAAVGTSVVDGDNVVPKPA